MDNLTIKLKHETLNAVLSRIDKADKATYSGLKAAVARNVLRIETQAKKTVPVNTGRLRNAITHYVKDLHGSVHANTAYAVGVEEGTPPGTLPGFYEIQYWFARKNRIPMSAMKTKGGIVQAIRKRIEQKGTKPQPFLIPAWEDVSIKFFNECKSVLNDAWD